MSRVTLFSIAIFTLAHLNALAGLPAVPSEHGFLGWRTNAAYQSRGLDPLSLKPSEMSCPGLLYPTHPQMSLKEYYNGKTGRYDHQKLLASDEACSVPAQVKNTSGVIPCLSPHLLEFVVVSDTYQDSCGNYFRGFVVRQYFRRHEKMSTLFTPGRSARVKERADFSGDVEAGETSGVAREEFALLYALFPTDLEKIQTLREQATAEGFSFDPATHTFRSLPKNR